ncbi:MAG: hypothetical protein ACOX8H_12870 [Ruminococcus sp.]|jgi:hypothetical protein
MKRKYGKRGLKNIGLLTLSVLTLSAITGCGAQQKTEEEIEKDMAQYLRSELSQQGVSEESVIENFEITDRETDKGAKIDDVWVSCDIVSENSQIEIDSAMAEYSLQGNQWVWDGGYLLSEVKRTAIPTVTEEEASAWFADGGYDEVNFLDRQTDTEAGTDTFYFQLVKKGEFKTVYSNGTVTYRLSGDDQWETSENDIEITLEREEWDVLGEWSYSDDTAVICVNIVSFDSEAMKMQAEYYYEEKGQYVFQSDGVLDLDINSRHNNDVFLSETIEQIDGTGQYKLTTNIELMLGGTADCINGEGSGVVFESYLLQRQ